MMCEFIEIIRNGTKPDGRRASIALDAIGIITEDERGSMITDKSFLNRIFLNEPYDSLIQRINYFKELAKQEERLKQ